MKMFHPEYIAAGQCPVHQVERTEGADSSAATSLTAQQLIDSLRTGDRALVSVLKAHGIERGEA
jgi:hypothetical protein